MIQNSPLTQGTAAIAFGGNLLQRQHPEITASLTSAGHQNVEGTNTGACAVGEEGSGRLCHLKHPGGAREALRGRLTPGQPQEASRTQAEAGKRPEAAGQLPATLWDSPVERPLPSQGHTWGLWQVLRAPAC